MLLTIKYTLPRLQQRIIDPLVHFPIMQEHMLIDEATNKNQVKDFFIELCKKASGLKICLLFPNIPISICRFLLVWYIKFSQFLVDANLINLSYIHRVNKGRRLFFTYYLTRFVNGFVCIVYSFFR